MSSFADTPTPNSQFRIFQHLDFLILIFCRTLQTFSYQILAVIIGWHMYTLKGDPLWLGYLGLSEAIPAIISSIFAGYLVDTRRPAQLMKLSFLLTTLNALFVFMVIFYGNTLFNNNEIVLVLFLAVFVTGLVRSITSPAQSSLIPTILPRSQIPQAMAINSTSYTLAQILGPALGGLVYGIWGAKIAFATPLVFSFLSSLFILKLSQNTTTFQPHGMFSKEPMLKIIKDGFDFLFSQKILISAMLLDMFSVLFGGAVAVLPVFADKIFHVNATGLGFLRAAPAVGSVIMSILLSIRPMKSISGSRLLLVVFLFGVCMIGFSVSTNIYVALFWLMMSGIVDAVSMVIRSTLVQFLTPQNLIGRVTSLSRVFITSSNEIGAFESGLAASAMGLVPSVIFGGVMTLVVVLFVNKWNPELRATRMALHKNT